MPKRTIFDYYKFWDIFIGRWRDGEDRTSEYLPEPWWGWHPRNGPLYSVTVNIAPGEGGKPQTRSSIAGAAKSADWTYSGLMSDTLRKHLGKTEKWHLTRRFRPLMRIFGVDVNDTEHHLSIELHPYHHEKGKSVKFQKADTELIDNTLLFAAEASKLITSPEGVSGFSPLSNIVIVRSTIKNVKKMCGDFIHAESPFRLPGVPIDIAFFRLSDKYYPQVSDVLFVCLWGANNYLPKKENMELIINHINN